jgi:hypothetical protein
MKKRPMNINQDEGDINDEESGNEHEGDDDYNGDVDDDNDVSNRSVKSHKATVSSDDESRTPFAEQQQQQWQQQISNVLKKLSKTLVKLFEGIEVHHMIPLVPMILDYGGMMYPIHGFFYGTIIPDAPHQVRHSLSDSFGNLYVLLQPHSDDQQRLLVSCIRSCISKSVIRICVHHVHALVIAYPQP